MPRSSKPPPATLARICKVPSVKLASLSIGTVISMPVLVGFHWPATTVPPVVITAPTVNGEGSVSSKVMAVALCVPVVALAALSVMMAVKVMASRLDNPPLNASKVVSSKLRVLLVFNSPDNIV